MEIWRHILITPEAPFSHSRKIVTIPGADFEKTEVWTNVMKCNNLYSDTLLYVVANFYPHQTDIFGNMIISWRLEM